MPTNPLSKESPTVWCCWNFLCTPAGMKKALLAAAGFVTASGRACDERKNSGISGFPNPQPLPSSVLALWLCLWSTCVGFPKVFPNGHKVPLSLLVWWSRGDCSQTDASLSFGRVGVLRNFNFSWWRRIGQQGHGKEICPLRGGNFPLKNSRKKVSNLGEGLLSRKIHGKPFLPPSLKLDNFLFIAKIYLCIAMLWSHEKQ